MARVLFFIIKNLATISLIMMMMIYREKEGIEEEEKLDLLKKVGKNKGTQIWVPFLFPFIPLISLIYCYEKK